MFLNKNNYIMYNVLYNFMIKVQISIKPMIDLFLFLLLTL